MPERLQALTLEQKVRLLTGADFWALHAEPAIGLRRMVCSDGPAGVRGERWDEREPSANVPSPTALAASWDEARAQRLGSLLASECRRKGVDVLLAPTVNLHRTPYAGRHFECFSEDPLLTARIGVAYVRGLQRAGVGATVKHFVANDSETERLTLDARIGARALRELYLAPFEAIVRDAQPWAVMAAYNGVNGATMTESPLLRDVLKDEWGFDGVVMSDWFAGRTTDAAARAGLDLLMPGPDGPWGDALVDAVRDGRVSEAAIDDKVRRLLRLAARVGALDGSEPAVAPAPWSDAQIAAELRSGAAAGMVLARNEGALLPLDRRALRRVAVIGPNAAVARTQGGGSATVFPRETVSPLEGLRAALGEGVEITHAAGAHVHTRTPVVAPELVPDGLDVRFLATDRSVLGAERRFGGALAWHRGFGPGVPADEVATVEVHARLVARTAGEHVVGFAGVGRFRLAVGGRTAFDDRLELPPGSDPAEAHMHPPQFGIAVPLSAGEALDVVLACDAEDRGAILELDVAEPRRPDAEELERAVSLAREADVAVVVVGTTSEVESEGFDRDSLALPGGQDDLVRAVAAENARTVVVVNAGAPVLTPWAEDVPAMLVGWFGGQEFGAALADVLLGDAEPGGRLPTTWPASEDGLPSTRPADGTLAYDEGLFVGYRAFERDGREPRFPFGHGLGYTTWDYLGASAGESAGGATMRVRVRNSGERRGREVVQVYASRPQTAVERPVRWLAGFAIAESDPGQETVVEIAVPARALAHWDEGTGAFTVEPGSFELAVGRSSGDLRCSAIVESAGQDGEQRAELDLGLGELGRRV